MNRTRYSNWQLWNMSFGLLGINFGWGLQMGNMSAIYEYLGAKPDAIPILWLAAPLTGLLVQPFIGYFSDHTWCALGRRKPYFLAGAILSAIALLLMPLSSHVFMAAICLWILDASVNVSMGPFRALVPDLLPEAQITRGYIFQGIAIAAGSVASYAFPYILQHVFGMSQAAAVGSSIPMIVRVSFWLGAVVFLFTILWTVITTKELPPQEIIDKLVKKDGDTRSVLREIWDDIVNMPRRMRRLAWVMFFSWMAFFCVVLYFPITVANNIFGGKPGSATYLNGLEWGGVCLAAYGVFFLIFSLVMPWFARRFSRRTIYMTSLIIGGLALCSIFLVHDKWNLMWIMLGFGIAFASMQTMPYAMLTDALPNDKLGIYMGIFNLFIVLPEIAIALGFGFVMHYILHENRMLGVVSGGVFMLIAAILALRVQKRPPAMMGIENK
ncbi:MAG: MFS transporter [Gammaproteobacteria bacterium]|nr:MFS transporter [Gammaproteobacteria bacterium]